MTAHAAMEPATLTLPADIPLARAAQEMADRTLSQVALVDAAGRYAGVLTDRGVTDALADGRHDDAPAASAAEQVTAVRGDQVLDAALETLEKSLTPAVPVLDPSGAAVIGWLTHQCVLRVIRRPVTPAVAGPPQSASSA